jgi:ADP-ribose pyrophosphatase YjhB (NUDIX family)
MHHDRTVEVSVNAVIVRDESILLVEFQDRSGRYFNLPGGGIAAGESATAALRRKVREETCAEIEVGPLLLVTEYLPPRYSEHYGRLHKLGLIFQGTLVDGIEPRLPERPDAYQIAVRWLPLAELPALLPALSERILALIQSPPTVNLFCDKI